MRLHIDIESRSEANIKKTGLYRYAEDPTTKVLMMSYRFENGPVHMWLPITNLPPDEYDDKLEVTVLAHVRALKNLTGQLHTGPLPGDVRAHIEAGGDVAAHNAQFERVMLNGRPGRAVDFPRLTIEQMTCTAIKAQTNGLPRDLERAAKALGTYPKKEVGVNDMRALAKPRSGKEKWYTLKNDPARWVRVIDYCLDDTWAESDLDAHLPDLSPTEREDYIVDQEMNDLGVRVDIESVLAAREVRDAYRAEVAAECQARTGFTPGQAQEIANWIRSHGYPQLIDLTADNVRIQSDDPACPENVRPVMKLFSTFAMKTPSKFDAMVNMRCADGRLHGLFLFNAAHTGRSSSSGVQLHNLARGHIKDPNTAIDVIRMRDLDMLKWAYAGHDPMKVLTSTIRGMLIASPGRELFSVDYAGIESRWAAWMFGEMWKLAGFRKQDDGTGPDSYVMSYCSTFGTTPKEMPKNGRQVGKVLELAFAFEGGLAALITAAATYQMDLPTLIEAAYPNLSAEALDHGEWMVDHFGTAGLSRRLAIGGNAIKFMWRENHPAHKQGWRNLRECFIAAVKSPGQAFRLPTAEIFFKVEADVLKVRLPSGRLLRYRKPELHFAHKNATYVYDPALGKWMSGKHELPPEVEVKPDLSYVGVDTETRQYRRTKTYGGKLTQNLCEGGCNDLLRLGIKNLRKEGLPVVMTVHDEAVGEIETGSRTTGEIEEIFTRAPIWSKGLPLAAGCWRDSRYKKD